MQGMAASKRCSFDVKKNKSELAQEVPSGVGNDFVLSH